MDNSSSGIITLLTSGAVGLFGLLIILVLIISGWKLFTKAGKPGWASLVPLYNLWVIGQIIYGDSNAWKPFLMFVPVVGCIFGWIYMFRFPQVYGKDPLFGVLNIFFPYIIMPIVAFGSDTYKGPVNSTF